ncbi:MAG TPA: hypothetical protein VHG08_22330 [Longimicrobium sp.]|nr:hypothetical protein [Longimicrobium sp.]
MRHSLRLISTPFSVLALACAAGAAQAQECVGLPGGRGMLSLGLEGMDGATGRGVSFAYQAPGASVQLHHRALDAFAQEDEISTSQAVAAVRLPRSRLPLCITVGAEWTDYEYSDHAGSSYTDGVRTESYHVFGGYQRLRVPVGVSLGREFHVGRGASLVPYLQSTVFWERERLAFRGGSAEERPGWGVGLNTGLAVAKDWFVVRANLAQTKTSFDRSPILNRRNDVPVLSVHFGVRF